jgi:hypothetical protein
MRTIRFVRAMWADALQSVRLGLTARHGPPDPLIPIVAGDDNHHARRGHPLLNLLQA